MTKKRTGTPAVAVPAGGWPLRPLVNPAAMRVALAASLIDAGAIITNELAERARAASVEPTATWLRNTYLPGRLWAVEMRLLHNLNRDARSRTKQNELAHLKRVAELAQNLLHAIRYMHDAQALVPILLKQIHQDDVVRAARLIAEPYWTIRGEPLQLGKHPLEVLAAAAAEQHSRIKASTEDKGKANLQTRLAGNPKLVLAKDCGRLFIDVGMAEKVVGTAGGLFHNIIVKCWENATGQESTNENGKQAVDSDFAEKAVAALISQRRSPECH